MSATCTSSAVATTGFGTIKARAATVPPAVRRGAWRIEAGQAISLKAGAVSVLRVRQGRVWITLDADRRHASEDLVLAPGESLRVTPGQRLVMEPWDGFGATYTWDADEPTLA